MPTIAYSVTIKGTDDHVSDHDSPMDKLEDDEIIIA